MTNKKKKKYIIILLVLGILFYTIYFFANAIINDPNRKITITYSQSGYTNLFNQNAQQRLTLIESLSSRSRDTIAFLNYDNKYSIQVSRIRINPSFDLVNDIIMSHNKPKGNMGFTLPYTEHGFKILYKDSPSEPISQIYLSLFGDSIKIILKNDTIANYFLQLKNAYIQLDDQKNYDIYIKSKTRLFFFPSTVPINITFLKKNNFLYFLLLYSKDGTAEITSTLLYKLIQ